MEEDVEAERRRVAGLYRRSSSECPEIDACRIGC